MSSSSKGYINTYYLFWADINKKDWENNNNSLNKNFLNDTSLVKRFRKGKIVFSDEKLIS